MSPYEHQARERKAHAIANHILGCYLDAGGTGVPASLAKLVLELAAAGPGVRAAFATGAGTKAPSAKTWLRIIELIGRHGVLAQIEAENNDDPFAGITEADNSTEAAERAKVERRPYVPARRPRSLPPGAVLYL